MYQTNPVGVELFSYVNTFLFQYICMAAGHISAYALTPIHFQECDTF